MLVQTHFSLLCLHLSFTYWPFVFILQKDNRVYKIEIVSNQHVRSVKFSCKKSMMDPQTPTRVNRHPWLDVLCHLNNFPNRRNSLLPNMQCKRNVCHLIQYFIRMHPPWSSHSNCIWNHPSYHEKELTSKLTFLLKLKKSKFDN